jgi:peptidyl-prolyl cis-trans isomerase SurA
MRFPRTAHLAAWLVVACALVPALARAQGAADTSAARPPAAPSGAAPAFGGQRLDGVAATVGGEPIFDSEIEEQLYLFFLQNRVRPDSTLALQVRKEILDRLIDEKVIVQEARRQNVVVAEPEVDKQVAQAIADVKQRLGGPEAYRAELSKEQITEADLRERYRGEIRRQMLANQLLRKQLDLKLEVSPAEAETYLRAHPDQIPKRAPEVRVAVIQIPVEAEPAAKAAAKARAQAALARVQKGESFARVAQEVSEDPATRNSGGDLGFFSRGQLDSTFEAAAFALKPGQTSGVVETFFGFHVIRVEEIDSTGVHARHILIRAEPTDADERRAETQANDLHRQLLNKADFAALATLNSRYKGAQGPGGDLGFVPVNAFTPELRQAIDSLAVGTFTRPVRTPQGYNIFKLLDQRPERPYELAEIRDEMPNHVRQIRLRQQYEEWVAALRAKAHIEIK